MRIETDPSDPDTLPERNRRAYAAWLFWRAYGKYCPDPLTPAERAHARTALAIKRARAQRWLLDVRVAQLHDLKARGKVLPFARKVTP